MTDSFLLHGTTIVEEPCAAHLVELAEFVVVTGDVALLETSDEFDPTDVLFF